MKTKEQVPMDTTTDAATQEEAPTTAQPPVDEPQAEAVTTVSEPPTTQEPEGEKTTEEPAPTDTSEDDDDLNDDQLLEWAGKKGFDLSTPEGQAKALRSMRTAEKKMHQATTQASELATQVGTQGVNPDATEAQRALHIATQLQNAEVIRNWQRQNNITADEDLAMGKYARENPEAAQLLNGGLITLDQFRAMAGAARPVDEAAIKAKGKKEALESLATKQGAGSVQGGASTQKPQQPSDPIRDVWEDD